MIKRNKFLILLAWVVLLLNGCAMFTSHYDAQRHENFTKLKAIHMKFFEDWTEGSEKTWKESEVRSYCDEGDLKFREAYEFAKSKDSSDQAGQRAVKILSEVRSRDKRPGRE